MYTANKRQHRYRTFLKFTLFISPFLLAIVAFVWFVFLRNTTTITSNFYKEGAQVAVVKPATKDFSNEFFKITLYSSWESLGKTSPFANQVYYEFQDKAKDSTNRWLRVYVDVFPKDFPLNRLLPISVVDNSIVPGIVSDDCTTFTGAPLSAGSGTTKTVADTWTARWQGVDFICSMTNPQNYTGTASAEEGLGTTFINTNNTKHKYFFVYIDHNVRPDYSIFVDALKSFQPL